MAAREDDIPWTEDVTLVNILSASAVLKINYWKDLGLELGIERHVLEKIDLEWRGKINDCKSDMFDHWLKNDHRPSWKKVSDAVERTRKRLEGAHEREESRKHILNEERKALQAISQLKESLETMDDTNMEIVDNQRKVAEELKEQKGRWESFQSRWRKEDREWDRGEERRRKKKEALEAHDLQESQFVKEFLREKGFPDNLSDQEVECYLRKDILEEEVTRSKQMRSRNHEARNHHEELQKLLGEADRLKKQVEKRVTKVYTRILKSLEELGMQPKNLRDLERQLTELESTLKKCGKALEDCNQTLREGETSLEDCENQLRMFTESFGEVVGGMQNVSEKLEKKVEQMERYIARIIFGATGAILGTIAFPIVGTVIGAVVGWEKGKEIDIASGPMTDREEIRCEIESMKRTLRNCKETANSAKHEHEELMKVLKYNRHTTWIR